MVEGAYCASRWQAGGQAGRLQTLNT